LPLVNVASEFFSDAGSIGFWGDIFFGTVAASVAIVAIISGNRSEVRAIDRLARERRTTFELEVLRDLAKYLDEHGVGVNLADKLEMSRCSTRLAMLPEDELPSWRLLAGWNTPPFDEGISPYSIITEYREALEKEVLDSIHRRVQNVS
jgi:hypothetical protein